MFCKILIAFFFLTEVAVADFTSFRLQTIILKIYVPVDSSLVPQKWFAASSSSLMATSPTSLMTWPFPFPLLTSADFGLHLDFRASFAACSYPFSANPE